MKVCKKCKIYKPVEDFCIRNSNKDGRHTTCKKCKKEISKVEYNQDKEKHLTRTRKYQEQNRDYFREKTNDHYHNNKEYYREWNRNKMKTDPIFRLKHSINALINHHLKRGKSKRSLEYLGCNMDEYKIHLENQFNENMNWDNYGLYWEIDHYHPLSKNGSFHYLNTRPLEIHLNRTKSDKIL